MTKRKGNKLNAKIVNCGMFTVVDALPYNLLVPRHTTVKQVVEAHLYIFVTCDKTRISAGLLGLLRSRYLGRHATLLPTNGCLNPNPICFPLFRVHVKITECTNHALPIISSETNHVSVYQFPA